MPHKSENELAQHHIEFGRSTELYVAPLRSLAEDRARFIRLCAKDSSGALTSQDVDAIVDCFGGTRADVIAEGLALGIPLK